MGSSGTPVLLIFQIMLNNDGQYANKDSLAKVDKLVAGDTKRYLVVVTSTGVQPKIMASREYPTNGFLNDRGANTAFPVYYLQISDYEPRF